MSRSLLASELEKFKSDIFVETGSYTGGGMETAIYCGFGHIISVELDDVLFDALYRRYKESKNITLFHGNSPDILSKDILPLLEKKKKDSVVIFLDAHSDEVNPLFEELDAIKNSKRKDYTILIDDLRQYGTYWKTISKQSIIDKVLEINPNYKISYMDSVNGKGDILVAQLY